VTQSSEAIAILEALRVNDAALLECVEHVCKDGTTALAMKIEVDDLGVVGVWVPEFTRDPKWFHPKEEGEAA
jgi:hypothetical protein